MGVAEILQKRREELAQKNTQAGQAYFAEFVQENNVTVLSEGLAYQVLVAGTGEKALVSDTVQCHYHGYNVAGEVFDSSVERGEPATFRLAKLIAAYQQVIPLVSMGSKIKIVSSHEFAYGNEALNKQIGPCSTLIFEVKLMAIVNAK